MLGWFKERKTGRRVLLNITSSTCKGFGVEYEGVEVATGRKVKASYHGEYYPYGTPVKQAFPPL